MKKYILSKLAFILIFVVGLFSSKTSFGVYCTSGLYGAPCSSGSNNYISNVSILNSSLNNSTGCTGNAGTAVNIYPATGNTTATLQQGMTYSLSITTSAIAIVSVWFDYNQDNVFDATEWIQLTNNSTPNVATVVSFTVPYTVTGATSFRIRIRDPNFISSGLDACATGWLSGELEQYTVTITPAPLCTNLPSAGITLSNLDTVCFSTSLKLSLQGAAIAQGLTQQWQSSLDGINWSNIIGATGVNLATSQNVATYYRCLVSCNNTTSASVSKYVSMLPTEYYNFNGGTIFSEHFDTWMDGCDNHDIPSINWLNYPISGNESWRRHDEGYSNGNWTLPGAPNMSPYLGSGAARFHSYSNNYLPGELSLHLNCIDFSSIKLDFWYLKEQVLLGVSKFEVTVSTNGGFTFGPPIATYTTANIGWINKVIDSVLVWNSPNCIIRFKDYGDFSGSYDTGIDELRIDGALGVSQADNDHSTISISPNPSNGRIEIRCSNKNFTKSKLQLMDVTGRILATEQFENSNSRWSQMVDLSNQPKGIYLVKLISDKQVFTQKIILE